MVFATSLAQSQESPRLTPASQGLLLALSIRRVINGGVGLVSRNRLMDGNRLLWCSLPLIAALMLPLAVVAQPAPPDGTPKQTAPKKKAPAKKAPAAKKKSEPATPPAGGGASPQLLGQFGDWGAYTGSGSGTKVCFAIAKPSATETKPPNRPRNPTYIFVSTRPAEKVRNEVSIIIGYAFRANTDATVEIGDAKFAMYTQNDGAWIKNAAEEPQLVEAMRSGTELIVRGTSSRGTQSSDRYSLQGLAQALDRVAQECP